MNKKKFKYNNLVRQSNLLSFLNPTSKGTKYWESPPKSDLSSRQIGRIILQFHQTVFLFENLGVDFKNKNLLDIGTGNGMIPSLISKFTKIKYSDGIDPYLDGEHTTSWQKHNRSKEREKIFNKIKNLVKKNNNILDFDHYKKTTKFENIFLKPSKSNLINKKNYKYNFYQKDALEISSLKRKYDLVYCKALEHIPNYEKLLDEIAKVTKKKSLVYFKHRSFFSFLGAHRYASTFIPWGHVFLNKNEIKEYVKIYHKNREKQFLNFFYNELSTPRFTVNDFIKKASEKNLNLKIIITEPYKKLDKALNLIKNRKLFFKKINKNYSTLSSDELFSGMHHIFLERV